VLVDRNKLTLYQISEPLQSTSSATAADPAPFGTDINGKPLNDPIPDTQIDPATGLVTSPPASGSSALLDAWTVTKPEVSGAVIAKLTAPSVIKPGQDITYTVSLRNDSEYALSGTQVRFHLPHGLQFAGTPSDAVTVHGDEVVLTLGYVALGAQQSVEIPASVPSNCRPQVLLAHAHVSSSTALPVETNFVATGVR
jgi:uncharacterized repeat protein (TIGR01451 family)